MCFLFIGGQLNDLSSWSIQGIMFNEVGMNTMEDQVSNLNRCREKKKKLEYFFNLSKPWQAQLPLQQWKLLLCSLNEFEKTPLGVEVVDMSLLMVMVESLSSHSFLVLFFLSFWCSFIWVGWGNKLVLSVILLKGFKAFL